MWKVEYMVAGGELHRFSLAGGLLVLMVECSRRRSTEGADEIKGTIEEELQLFGLKEGKSRGVAEIERDVAA